MALYDFKCVHQNCGHEFVVRMSMRENLAQSQDKFCKVECPMCLQNKPKRLIRPKTLLVDCFGTHHSGTFDSSDGRHPPEMDGVTFSNRREWTKKREAWGIASKGEVDPTDRGVAKFRAGEDLSQVSQIVMPQVIKALVVAKKPIDYVTLAESVAGVPRETVQKCLLRAASKGILSRPQPGMYALPG
jgi:hypothetical protein